MQNEIAQFHLVQLRKQLDDRDTRCIFDQVTYVDYCYRQYKCYTYNKDDSWMLKSYWTETLTNRSEP